MKVLAVGGHPSDIFPNIGGTVAKHAKRGDDVVLLTLTFGVEVHTEMLLGKSEGEIKDIRPDIIISAHYSYRETGWGGDHGVAARMLESAPSWHQHFGIEPHHTKAIWFCAHGHLDIMNHPAYHIPNVYVDITDTIEEKIQSCITTWTPPQERHEGTDRLVRRLCARRSKNHMAWSRPRDGVS